MAGTSGKRPVYLLLHVLLLVSALASLAAKMVGKTMEGAALADIRFWVWAALAVGLYGVYALGWQQVLKRLPVSVAYAYTAVTFLWLFLFDLALGEPFSAGKAAGLLLAAGGVVCCAADGEGTGGRDGA